jgi:hypothetical protein
MAEKKTYTYWRPVQKRNEKGETVIEREPVALPSDQFRLTSSRYWIDNPAQPHMARYIEAGPGNPAIVTLPEGSKLDRDLVPVDVPAQEIRPHYAKATGPSPRADDRFAKREP